MSIVDVSEVELPGEAKQNNLPPECGQSIDGVLMAASFLDSGKNMSWFTTVYGVIRNETLHVLSA
jgi:hypothetical protein